MLEDVKTKKSAGSERIHYRVYGVLAGDTEYIGGAGCGVMRQQMRGRRFSARHDDKNLKQPWASELCDAIKWCCGNGHPLFHS